MAQCIIDSAEQHANDAQYAADVAKQRVVAAQSDADVAKAKQKQLEHELQNVDLAFQEERKIRTTEFAAAQHTTGALQHELRSATTRLDAQSMIVQDVTGIEMDTEFLNAVRVRPWFFECYRVHPSVSVCFF